MPSKHVNAKLLVQSGLYDDLNSFAELEQRISKLGSESTKVVAGVVKREELQRILQMLHSVVAQAGWLAAPGSPRPAAAAVPGDPKPARH